jgi:hypothetical protein
MITRRALLAAGIAFTGLRAQAIRFAIGPDLSLEQRAGIRFGLTDAGRAASLLGRSLDVRPGADLLIDRDGIDAAGTRFFVRATGDMRQAALNSAYAAGVPRSSGLRALEWHHTLTKFGASELNDRFTRHGGARMSSDHWLGWMAVKILAESALRARPGEPVARAIARTRFDGHKGTVLGFPVTDGAWRLIQPLYVVDTTRDAVVWPAP